MGDTHTHTLRIQRGGTPRTRRYLCEFALDKEAFPSTNSRWMMGMSGGVLALCTLYQKALLLTTDTRSRFLCVCVCVCVCVLCICMHVYMPCVHCTRRPYYSLRTHAHGIYTHTHMQVYVCIYAPVYNSPPTTHHGHTLTVYSKPQSLNLETLIPGA